MRKIILYTAVSLNGKIARPDGDVKWLESVPNPEGIDYGYSEFYNSVDTTIQGFNTYNQILNWGIAFPYPDKKNYVLTRKKDSQDTAHAEFITHNHIQFIRELKKEKGKDIWLIGGGQVNSLLLNEGLIDELMIFVMPIVIPDGIELFEITPDETILKLASTKSFPTGVVELRYLPRP